MEALIDICFNGTHQSYAQDFKQVLKRASDATINRMLIPGSSVSDSRLALELAKQYPDQLKTTAGVHPHLASEWNTNTTICLQDIIRPQLTVAIGETGLDYNRNYSTPKQQQIAFEQQIQLAIETRLPLFMHQRDAHKDFIALLKPYRNQLSRAVVHCFTGSERELNDYIEMDLYIGITGWICDERRGQHLKDILHHIPAERLMLETDAPYLLPRNMKEKPRNRRNEPVFLQHIATEIAACLDIDIDSLARQTTQNTLRFFDWK